jgi:hypothetical protein
MLLMVPYIAIGTEWMLLDVCIVYIYTCNYTHHIVPGTVRSTVPCTRYLEGVWPRVFTWCVLLVIMHKLSWVADLGSVVRQSATKPECLLCIYERVSKKSGWLIIGTYTMVLTLFTSKKTLFLLTLCVLLHRSFIVPIHFLLRNICVGNQQVHSLQAPTVLLQSGQLLEFDVSHYMVFQWKKLLGPVGKEFNNYWCSNVDKTLFISITTVVMDKTIFNSLKILLLLQNI